MNPSEESPEVAPPVIPTVETSQTADPELNSDQPDAEPDHAGTLPSADSPSYEPSIAPEDHNASIEPC